MGRNRCVTDRFSGSHLRRARWATLGAQDKQTTYFRDPYHAL